MVNNIDANALTLVRERSINRKRWPTMNDLGQERSDRDTLLAAIDAALTVIESAPASAPNADTLLQVHSILTGQSITKV